VRVAVSSVALSADGRSVVLLTGPLAAGQVLAAVSYAYSTWPVTILRNSAGLPATPFFANM